MKMMLKFYVKALKGLNWILTGVIIHMLLPAIVHLRALCSTVFQRMQLGISGVLERFTIRTWARRVLNQMIKYLINQEDFQLQ